MYEVYYIEIKTQLCILSLWLNICMYVIIEHAKIYIQHECDDRKNMIR